MDEFPRTEVGGQSISRMIVGTNWFLGYSHTSAAKDRFIKALMTRERIADILTAFLERGVDAIMGMPVPMLTQAIGDAQDRVGRPMYTILTPTVAVLPGGPPEQEPERVYDLAKELGATFCTRRSATSIATRRSSASAR